MKTISIKAPAAKVGDLVTVKNNRRKREPWEHGILVSAEYDLGYKSWSYRVQLNRVIEKQHYLGENYTSPIFVYVGDSGIIKA